MSSWQAWSTDAILPSTAPSLLPAVRRVSTKTTKTLSHTLLHLDSLRCEPASLVGKNSKLGLGFTVGLGV